MNIDPEDFSIENEVAKIMKPLDDLLAREAEVLKHADEMIGAAEAKAKKVVIEAKRDGEE